MNLHEEEGCPVSITLRNNSIVAFKNLSWSIYHTGANLYAWPKEPILKHRIPSLSMYKIMYPTPGHCCIPARDILERLGVSFGSPYKVNEPFDTLVNTAWVVPSCWSVMYTLVAIIRIDGQSDRLEGLYKYSEGAYYITPWSWKGEIIESLRNVILDRK